MTPEVWERVKTVLDHVTDRSPAERNRILLETEPEVRREVEILLREQDRTTSGHEQFLSDAIGRPSEMLNAILGQFRSFGVGDVLLGRFEITEFLGSGGMGEVYRAQDRQMGEIAIKTVRFDLAGEEQITRRFRQEVQRARRVSHVNVCRVHELFETPNEIGVALPFATMEYIAGSRSLFDAVEESGAFAEPECRNIARQICSGLQAAHQADILHRDLKSSNVLLSAQADRSTRAVITDFGLARPLSSTEKLEYPQGRPSGTRAYLAPELFDGVGGSVQSDLFALGVVLFRLSTGKYPFASAHELSPPERIRVSPRAIRPSLSPSWDELVVWCLQSEAHLRPASASMLLHRLEGGKSAASGLFSRRAVICGFALVGTGAALKLVPRGGEDRLAVLPAEGLTPALLEDFADPGKGAALGRAARNLMRVVLEKSSRVRLLGPDQVRKATDAAGVTGNLLSGGTALAVARASEAKILIGGQLQSRRGGFQLTVRVRDEASGRIRGEAVRTGKSVAELSRAVESAAVALGLISPELATRAQTGLAPMPETDTTRPDALEMFTAGLVHYSQGEAQEAIGLFREARRLDTNFALAFVYEAMALSAYGRDDLALVPMEQGWKLRDRLRGREKLQAEAQYYVLTGDLAQSNDRYRVLASMYPYDGKLQRHLSLTYSMLEDHPLALQYAQRCVQADPHSPLSRGVLISALADTRDLPGAEQALAEAERDFPSHPLVLYSRAHLELMRNQHEAALACCQRLEGHRDFTTMARREQVKSLILAGRLEEAEHTAVLENELRLSAKDLGGAAVHQYWLAQMFLLKGLPAKATPYIRSLASLPAQPCYLPCLRNAAGVAAEAGDEPALAKIEASLARIAPRYGGTYSQAAADEAAGLLSGLRGNRKIALQALGRAHAQFPDLISRYRYAVALQDNGRVADAAPLLSRVAQAKCTAVRYDSTILWLKALPRAGAALQMALHSPSARTMYDEYFRHWGKRNDLRVVREALQSRQ